MKSLKSDWLAIVYLFVGTVLALSPIYFIVVVIIPEFFKAPLLSLIPIFVFCLILSLLAYYYLYIGLKMISLRFNVDNDILRISFLLLKSLKIKRENIKIPIKDILLLESWLDVSRGGTGYNLKIIFIGTDDDIFNLQDKSDEVIKFSKKYPNRKIHHFKIYMGFNKDKSREIICLLKDKNKNIELKIGTFC